MQAEPRLAIPSQRFTTMSLPSLPFSTSSNVHSRGFSSHLSEPGARYSALMGRSELLDSWMVAAPLGQRRPRVWGVSGWPSMSMILLSRTYMSWAQPTAQYGHTPGNAFASLIFKEVAAASTGARSNALAPTATPAAEAPAYLKKSRRDKLMATLLPDY